MKAGEQFFRFSSPRAPLAGPAEPFRVAHPPVDSIEGGYHDYGTTQAYALSPVRNPTTNTFWSRIGTNILSGTGTLSAKSSSDGRVGASLTASPSGFQTGSAIVGRRTTGFANLSNVQGLAFDQAGTLVTASADTLTGSGLSLPTVQSIAASPFGSIGVVTSSNGVLSYYEKSPVPGWNSAVVASGTVFGGDLAIDSIGRPFVAYDPVVVPEPSSLMLAAVGVLAVGLAVRRSRCRLP